MSKTKEISKLGFIKIKGKDSDRLSNLYSNGIVKIAKTIDPTGNWGGVYGKIGTIAEATTHYQD